MNDTPMKKVAMPICVRRRRRTWLTTKGHVVTAQAAKPDPVVGSMKWEAKVVDTATEQEIESYPKLAGDCSVSSDVNVEHAAQLAYMNQCRFMDGEKPDVELLQTNVNAGIWSIDVKVFEPETTAM